MNGLPGPVDARVKADLAGPRVLGGVGVALELVEGGRRAGRRRRRPPLRRRPLQDAPGRGQRWVIAI